MHGWVSFRFKHALYDDDILNILFSSRLGEGCSHVAALLFKVESAVRNHNVYVQSLSVEPNVFYKGTDSIWCIPYLQFSLLIAFSPSHLYPPPLSLSLSLSLSHSHIHTNIQTTFMFQHQAARIIDIDFSQPHEHDHCYFI